MGSDYESQFHERRAFEPSVSSRYEDTWLGSHRFHFERIGREDSSRDDSLRSLQGAQIAVARGIAETTTGTEITVNSVLVGPTRSEGVEAFIGQMVKTRGVSEDQVVGEFFKTVRPSSIIKRFILPQEVAALVVYLCSPLAAATNGAAVRIDGGVVEAIP